MNNFKIIYRILKYLEAALDVAAPDMAPIKAESLGLTEERWKGLDPSVGADAHIGPPPSALRTPAVGAVIGRPGSPPVLRFEI